MTGRGGIRALVVALVLAAIPAAAAPVRLAAGEYVTLQQAATGEWRIVGRGQAAAKPESESEQVAIDKLAGKPPAAEVPAQFITGKHANPVIADGAVRFVLRRVEGRSDMILVVENGFSQFLRYSAMLERDGRLQPTTVCEVLNGKRPAYEYWPFSFAGISLDGFTLIPPPESVACR